VFDVELLALEDGTSPFEGWFERLPAAVADRVDTAVEWMRRGNLGAHKAVGEGVHEHRIHHGPGYRIYFGRDGLTLIVHIGGGTKKGQSRDIRAAQRLWKEYKDRKRRT
jgi:putative addiction module killer protein